MTDKIQGGYIILARRLAKSEIMQKPPLYLKLFIWMLLQASFKDHGNLKRGQFFTSLKKMGDAMAYKRGFHKIRPSIKEIRGILEFLTIARMIGTRKGTHGTLITVLNYEHYQDILNYEGHNEGHRQGQNTKKEGNRKKGITSEKFSEIFSSLLSRYPDPKLIERALEAIASTRKTNRIADRVKLSILQSWERYTIAQVETGIRTYLDRDYAGQGKREEYLLGIIRRQENGNSKKKPASSSPRPVNKEPWY